MGYGSLFLNFSKILQYLCSYYYLCCMNSLVKTLLYDLFGLFHTFIKCSVKYVTEFKPNKCFIYFSAEKLPSDSYSGLIAYLNFFVKLK